MSWGKTASDAWSAASDTAKATVSKAMTSMVAAADLAVEMGNAAKREAVELVDKSVNAAVAARNKVVDTYQAVKQDFALRNAANAATQGCPLAGGPKLGDLDCALLAEQKSEVQQAQVKAKLAAAVYEKPGEQNLPPGWSPASDDDLKELGLLDPEGRKLTEIPGSDFKADIFKGADGKYAVVFKGTTMTSLEDWKNNLQQGIGNSSSYYSQALTIADQLQAHQPGNVEYIGHSLGGGMASAAAALYGSPATTFNAAGLHDKTLLRNGVISDSSKTAAYNIQGDILSAIQDKSFGLGPKAVGQRYELSPADSVTKADILTGMVTGAVAGPVFGVVAGAAKRGVRLHSMDSVNDALDKREGQIVLLQQHKGC